MNGLDSFTRPQDWIVVGVYLAVVTLLVWVARGRPESRSDFHLADRTLPWILAAASVAATELGIAAFLLVPAILVRGPGDGTHLTWILGALLARVAVAFLLIPSIRRSEAKSPFDYLAARLGRPAGEFAQAVFFLGGLVAHAARLLLASAALDLIAPWPPGWGLVLIVACAALWTLPGGIRSVAWTNAVNLLLVATVAALTLGWAVGGFEKGWTTLFETARSVRDFEGVEIAKLKVLDFGLGSGMEFTFWTALFASPFLSAFSLVADPVQAQALLSCRGPKEAGRAVLWSGLGQIVVVLMSLLGLAIFVSYRIHPPTDPLILRSLEWSAGAPGEARFSLPVWFVTEVPGTLRGLLLAALIASAVSGLNAFLLALAQGHRRMARREVADSDAVQRWSPWLDRLSFAACSLGMAVASVGFVPLVEWGGADASSPINGVLFYLAGPLLAMVLAAVWGRGRVRGLVAGSLFSIGLVALARWNFPARDMSEAPGAASSAIDSVLASGPLALFASPWAIPLSTGIVLLCGWSRSRKNSLDILEVATPKAISSQNSSE